MQDLDAKKKVLSEIMDLMDEKEGDKLKTHPKLMAAKVEVVKPKIEGLEEIVSEEKPLESAMEEASEEEISPEMIQKLLEMYEQSK